MPPVSTVRVKGGVLRTLRTQRGLTMKQLAARVARHPQSIRRLETGDGKLASEVFAYQLANALGVDVGDFTYADDKAEAGPKGVAA